MKISPEDLLRRVIITEGILNLKRQAKETGDGITSLQRCRDDFGNISKDTVDRCRQKALVDLRQIDKEVTELEKEKQKIDDKVNWREA